MLFKDCKEFDERQQKIRGDIWKHSFMLLTLFFLADYALQRFEVPWADGPNRPLLVYLIPLVIISAELIWRDSYFTQKRKAFGAVSQIIIGAGAIALIVMSILHMIDGEAFTGAKGLTENGIHFACACLMLLIPVNALIKGIVKK